MGREADAVGKEKVIGDGCAERCWQYVRCLLPRRSWPRIHQLSQVITNLGEHHGTDAPFTHCFAQLVGNGDEQDLLRLSSGHQWHRA